MRIRDLGFSRRTGDRCGRLARWADASAFMLNLTTPEAETGHRRISYVVES